MTAQRIPITDDEATDLLGMATARRPLLLPWGSTRGLYLMPGPGSDWAALALAGRRLAQLMRGQP